MKKAGERDASERSMFPAPSGGAEAWLGDEIPAAPAPGPDSSSSPGPGRHGQAPAAQARETGAEDPDQGYFHRYIGLPFETLILQGSSTRQLSFAVAIGVTFGLFPIMGLSIPFCFVAALVLKAPQPLTHAVNYAVYPVQIPLIFVFVRLGEWIMGAPNVSLAPSEILDLARTDMVRFIEEFGLTCLHATLAWCVSAPLIFVATFSAVRPVIAKLRDKHLMG